MKLTKTEMPETFYRVSRCCRVLGNPSAYLVMKIIGSSRKNPSEISDESKLTLNAVSITLRHMRNVDLLRYETKGRNKEYWVKDPKILKILAEFETWVDSNREKKL